MESMDVHSSRHRTIDRRSFLKLSGLLGLGVASVGLLPAAAEAVKFNRKYYKVSKNTLAMGTFVSMTLIHPSRDEAEEAMEGAFERIRRLSGLMNRFDERTAVGVLNRSGSLSDIPPEVMEVVAEGLKANRLTRGAFDMTVKPVVDLFRENFQNHKTETPPSDRQLDRALHLVDSGKIRMGKDSISFDMPGMGITLDGIAKGYIVDKASEYLSERGIKNHLINAGGDIRTRGTKGAGKPWTVAVEDPRKRKHYPDVIHMKDAAVATSGNYEIFYDREKMFHHIVDPFTGLSPALSTSVSVLAENAMTADALSTSVFVMGPEGGTAFINSLRGVDSFVINRNGECMKSAGWRNSEA